MDIQKIKYILESIEWIWDSEYDDYFCPVCDNLQRHGHKSDCDMKELVEEIFE